MSRSHRFDWFAARHRRKQRRAPRYSRRLRTEALEDRRVLAVANIVSSPLEIQEETFDIGFQSALQLDGVDDYVGLSAAEGALDTLTASVSFEAWIRIDDDATGVQTIVSKGERWFLQVDADTGVVQFSTFDGTLVAEGVTDVADGEWRHIAATMNAIGLTARVYVDGVEEGLESRGTIGGMGQSNIQGRIGDNAEIAGVEFQGDIDEVRIWNTLRTADQIAVNKDVSLSGDEAGLVAYYNFNDEDATDLTGGGGDGVLVGGAGFVEPQIIGEIVVQLDAAVTAEPGIILSYEIGGASTATEGVDFYASQLDISTVDGVAPTNSVFIAKGQDSAVISLAALPDAIVETDETIIVNLITATDPFSGATEYTLGVDTSVTVTLLDSERYAVGIAVSNAFGEDAVAEDLHLDANGQVTFEVKLTSQPESPVTVSIGNAVGGSLSTASLVFDEDDWHLPQIVTISGLAGDDDGVEDSLGVLTLTATSGDSAYNLFQELVEVRDESNTTKVNVDEGGEEQPITPTISIVNSGDAIEGGGAPGVLTIASDVAAPAGGLTVYYTLQDDSGLGARYTLLDDGDSGLGSRRIVIPEGELTAAILVLPEDDDIAAGDIVIAADLVADATYAIGGSSTASVQVEEDDTASILTAVFTNADGVSVVRRFDDDTFLTTSEAGDDFTFGVRLSSEPVADVTVTVTSSNPTEGQVNAVLVFDETNWDVYQTVTVVSQDDGELDGDIRYNIGVVASGADSVYAGADANFSITNEDDESREQSTVDTSNDSSIVATIAPVTVVGAEGGAEPQFEIVLSEPAPAGGLSVGYVIFERSATGDDLGVPDLVERIGDDNPLALTRVDANFIENARAESLTFADLDNDGDQDGLLTLEDGTSQLLINDGTDEVPDFIVDDDNNPLLATGGRGAALGDVDGDGDVDILQVNAARDGFLYFENQLTDTGVFEFVERTGGDNPFDALALVDPETPALVDLDNDGQLELVVTRSGSAASDYYEVTGAGDYTAAGTNPLAVVGLALGDDHSLTFGDIDRDGDLDAVAGTFAELAYFENVGTPTDPLFVQRTGDANPADSLSTEFAQQIPGLVDINNDGDLDLFYASEVFIGEVDSRFEVRYAESPEFQEVLIPEGLTSYTVSIPITDDVVDESFERFEVALLSQQTQTYDVVAAADFNDEFEIEVVEVFADAIGVKYVKDSAPNIQFTELLAGTVLDFGEAQATVTTTTVLDNDTLSILVPVTFDSGAVEVDDIATVVFDDTITLFVPDFGDFFDGEVGLQIDGDETANAVLLQAGTQLTFSGGTTLEVTQTTLVNSIELTSVPATLISGAGVGFFETVDVAAPIGELELQVNEPGVDFYALAAGDVLTFDDGSTFVVTDPAIVPSVSQTDYNADGRVDSLDYLVWRESEGSTTDLAADGNGDGVVDQADYDLWVERFSFEQNDPILVTGYVIGGQQSTAGAGATATEAGYRITANLEVTAAFDGSVVGLRIDETAYESFTIPVGTVLRFEGGATVTVEEAVTLNNLTGTSVSVALTSDSTASTILLGDASDTADFSDDVTFRVTQDGGDIEGGLFIEIVNLLPEDFTLEDGVVLTFDVSGITVSVFGPAVVDNDGVTNIFVDVLTPGASLFDILEGDTASIGFQSVGSIEFTIEDNDEAGVNLGLSGTTTTEAGGSQTIDVSLQTEPKENVTVILAVDGGEAVLSDADESGASFVQPTFTPYNWDVPQQVTVTGLDDDIDDGDVDYTLRTTTLSADNEYSDEVIDVFFRFDLFDSQFALLQIEDLNVADAILPQNTLIYFENGAVVQADVDEDVLLLNDLTRTVEYVLIEPVDTIPAGETATAVDFILNNDDLKTDVDVVAAYDPGTGLVGLAIEFDENDVLAATLLAGYDFTFSNGTVARLDADVTLLGGGVATFAQVTLIEGTEIPAGATTTFAETLDVTSAYDAENGDIGLTVSDPLIASVTFAADTRLEFSNGAYGTFSAETVIINSAELIVEIDVDPDEFSSQASGYYSEQLVEDTVFTNTDDDGAGITVSQTDPTLAVAEGAVNNYFTVVLESEPTDVVAITLTPSDDNIRLEGEFMGEPITIYFDPSNWDVPQTVEVSAVDDVLLEYDHMSTIAVSVASADSVYAGVALPNDVEVFITDDELPTASVVVVAGAIEANSPGYFLIELSAPAPEGHDGTGIVVTYSIDGTAQATGDLSNTADVQPITGTVRIAPGETRSQIIAFPIDDFLTEGIDLIVGEDYPGGDAEIISLGIDVAPFSVEGAFVSTGGDEGTVELLLGSTTDDPGVETTILSQGTVLLFAGMTTAVVTETTIVREDVAVAVPIELLTAMSTDIDNTVGDVYQQILLPEGTELEFVGGAVLTVTEDTDITNEPVCVSVPVTQTEGEPLAITAGTDAAATRLPGESVVVSITTDDASEYRLGDDSSGAIIILDNDKPGVRIAEIGDETVVIEGEGSSQFMVSLLSQPFDDVDITLTAPATVQTLLVEGNHTGSDTTIRLKVDDPSVVSLLLPQGAYDFGGTTVTLDADVTLLSEDYVDVGVSLSGGLTAGDTAAYSYNELLFENGTNTTTLAFTGSDWYQLQTVTLTAVDDLVVEAGDSHTVDLEYSVTSLDPNYNLFEVADQPITVIDRRFDVDNTTDALVEGFLSLEASLDSVELPILGEFGDVAPPIFDAFLESLVEEILAAENLTAETLGDAFENAINAQLGDLNPLPVELVVTEITTDEIAFNLSFGETIEESIPLSGSLGLEALNLSIESEGTIDLFVDYLVSIGFGISQDAGFFLSVEETFFEVAAGIGLSDDFAATGELGFLQVDVANAVNFVGATVVGDFDLGEGDVITLDIADEEFDPILLEEGAVIVLDSGVEITVAEEIEIDGGGLVEIVVGDATDVVGDGDTVTLGDVDGTMLDASFVVTLVDPADTSGDDTRLTLSELAAARGGDPLDFIDYGFSGDAVLDLEVSTTVSGDTAFPSFSFNLASTLPLFNYADEDEAGADETPTLTVDTGFSGVTEGAASTLVLTASGVSSSARIAKGTQLQFGDVRVVVDKTVTFSADGTELVSVTVIGDGDSQLGESITIGVGESATLADSAFNIAFNDITLDLGGFVTDLLGPVITGINDLVDPFQPIIDVLSSEVALFSTLGLADAFDQDDDGAATLIEIGLTLAGGLTNENTAAKVFDFIDAVTGVIELTGTLADLEESIENGDNLALNFGSYVLQDFKGGSSAADATEVDVEDDGAPEDPEMSPEDQTMATGNSSVTGFFDSLDELGITLDIVENPLNVIQLLLGQDIDLVTWDVPELDFSFEIERSFPVFAGINGIIRGGFNIYSDLVFGFDTFGFSQWKENDFAVEYAYLVFDGFYVSDIDPETGEDIPELTLDATIAAGVEANAVVASISAIGGLSGTAELDLIDVGEYSGESDGRIRGSEIFSRISRPAQLFELTGSIDAFLAIEVNIGINLGFWKIQVTVFERELARVTLFEFTIGGGGGGGASSTVIASAAEDPALLEAAAPVTEAADRSDSSTADTAGAAVVAAVIDESPAYAVRDDAEPAVVSAAAPVVAASPTDSAGVDIPSAAAATPSPAATPLTSEGVARGSASTLGEPVARIGPVYLAAPIGLGVSGRAKDRYFERLAPIAAERDLYAGDWEASPPIDDDGRARGEFEREDDANCERASREHDLALLSLADEFPF